MKEYKISKFISVKKTEEDIFICINNRPFNVCKYLLIEVPFKKIKEVNELNSIDLIAQKLNPKLEKQREIITLETEFWGHCSNLQAWVEYDYDTSLLHRSLAFPLLKRLSELDPKARIAFKEEIIRRYNEGNSLIREFLSEEGYLNKLNNEEKKLLIKVEEGNSIDFLEEKLNEVAYAVDSLEKIKDWKYYQKFIYCYEGRHVTGLKLDNLRLESFPTHLKFFKNLKILILSRNKIENIPHSITILKHLETLNLSQNKIRKLPDFLKLLKSIRCINLSYNKIENLSESLMEIETLKTLYLSGNLIKNIPESLIKIKNNIILS